MAPIVVALLIATGWVLIAVRDVPARDWPLWLLALCATLVVWRTRIHLLWLIGTGAVLGAVGLSSEPRNCLPDHSSVRIFEEDAALA